MRRLALFALLCTTLGGCATLGARSSMCLGEHSYIATQRDQMRAIVAGTDTSAQRLRTVFGLPAANASAVVLLAEEALCSQAAKAFHTSIGQSGDAVRPVWLLKLGPQHYLVADGWRKSAESQRYYAAIFDENWVLKHILETG